MLGFNVFAADTDEDDALLASSIQQAFVELRSGQPSKVRPPVQGYLEALLPIRRTQIEAALSCSAVGFPARVKAALEGFVEQTGADEAACGIDASQSYSAQAESPRN